jgi:hypothetical protein
MCRRRLLNLAVQRGDAPAESGDQGHQNAHHSNRRLDHRYIPDRRNRLADLLQALVDQLRTLAVVLGEKGAQARLADFLQSLQGRPPFQ